MDMQFHQNPGKTVVVYDKESVTLMEDSSFEFTDAECSVFKIRINGKQLDVSVLYCYLEGSVLTFFEELGHFIEETITSSSELIMLGNIDVKADATDTPDAVMLRDFLDPFNLQNHVSFPTHDKGHTLTSFRHMLIAVW